MKPGFTKQDFYDKLKPNGDCLEWNAGCFRHGYGQTWLVDKMVRTHRLALELEGVDTTGHHVLHSCDNRKCCNPKHLRLGTNQDNVTDRNSKGRQARGARQGNAKLTEKQVLEIRAITGITQRAIADHYGVSEALIGYIRRRKIWQHI